MQEFERDLEVLAKKLCRGEEENVSKEIVRLKEHLKVLHSKNLVKINHSVMELVCAKYLVLAGYIVDLEKSLNGLSCDIFASKGLGTMIIEVETGFVPPDHALDPSTYIRARIASKITRYSHFAEKFGLAVPPHYVMPIPKVLMEPPRNRSNEEITAIKALCDLYYSNPPVSLDEIKNSHIHAVYILDVDNGVVKETEPVTYIEKTENLFSSNKVLAAINQSYV